MRPISILFMILLLQFSLQAEAAEKPVDDTPQFCPTAKTQYELSICASKDYKATDGEMGGVYQQVLAKFAGDKKFIEKFKASQRAWIKFRDAEVEAMYPNDENAQAEYGSAYPMCVSNLLADLTRERTKQLKAWLDGGQEGDVCRGSLSGPDTPDNR